MKKRILAAFLAATMVLTLVVGCSSSKESSDDGESEEVKGSGKEIAVMVPSADH